MVGKTALNKEMKHLNGAYFRTIINKLINYNYGLYKQTFRRKLRLG